MLTVLLSRADVSRNTQALQLLADFRSALTARVSPDSVQTMRFKAPAPGGSTLVRQAALPNVPAYAVTVQAETQAQRPASRTVLQLHDGSTGKLLAVMDAGHLQSLRSSLMSALATDVLARADAERVAVLGSGAAASGAIKALRLVRSLREVFLSQTDLAASTEQAMHLQNTLATPVRAPDKVADAVANADIVVLTGGVSLPDVPLKPGCHITVLGAEQLPECPLSTSLLQRATCLSDVSEPLLPWPVPFVGQLGQVLDHTHPGRTSPLQTTVFFSTGPAFLDLLAAWHVYVGAKEDEALTRLDLEA